MTHQDQAYNVIVDQRKEDGVGPIDNRPSTD